ncbi:hypothetical protein SLEP1_g35659 [Rubroshorea leprosula]|uniref:Disease resistance protein At4g27190-like leucine-rich repeats domain-containing protein n=1 Tax=Rubroshorea leprosula TaxID=152421 RepID=A0AAV5KP57_9ROSI|nr:hypothetical protein SLEP1_g35659 [Rubroshorea leprosula]
MFCCIGIQVVPRLKTLSLTSDDIAMICNRQFPEDLFSNVKVLRLLCYHNESEDFPFRFIERFFNLEKLFIGCSSFKELFPSVASIDCPEKDVGWQLRIRKLTLDALCNLKYIWNQGSPSDLLVENLKSLKVQRCDCLISLSESTASFRNLTTLFVTSCQILRSLFSSTTVQSLVHLQTMRIEQCKLLSEIVGDEGDGLGHAIVFSKLKVLKLKCLTRLASFCSANFTFEFPLLEEVMVVQCPNFETFCHGVVRTPSLQKRQLTEEDNLWHPAVELNNTINQLYKEMAGYAGLQELNLSDFPQLMEIWYKNPQEILDFKQLRELEICNCSNLTYLLTPSMALSLVTLERLKVQNSEMMEHIITGEGTMEADEKEMIFPQLKAINLESCSNLTSFCVGNYKLVFPLLAVMEVIDCPEMVTFASTFSTVQVKEAAEGESAERIRKEDIDPTEPFFSDQVSVPGLMFLVIHGMGSLNMIWDDKLDADSFYRLQMLWVASCEKLLNIFPITMLGRFKNLDVLEIRNCVSLEKIFQHQGPSASESQALKSSQSTMVETAINFVLPKVRRLILVGLPNLKSLYPQMHTTKWPSLETLVVFRCNQVQILASELLSYQRTSEATQLKSQNEHTLFWVNKATFPSLVELTVQRNDSMKVIWYSDDVKEGILYSKLETLKLKDLQRLESICSGSCNFEFPSLKDVLVMACPKMQTFSEGEVSTPKLQKVKLTEDEDEGCWGDGFKPRIVLVKNEW